MVSSSTRYLVLSLNGALNTYAAFDSTSDGFYFINVDKNYFKNGDYVKLLIIDKRINFFKF